MSPRAANTKLDRSDSCYGLNGLNGLLSQDSMFTQRTTTAIKKNLRQGREYETGRPHRCIIA